VAGLKPSGVQTVAWDLTEEPGPALDGLGQLDAVVHCAGLSSNWGPRAAFEIANVHGTRRLIEQLREWGAPHFLYVSSSSVYFALCDRIDVGEADPLPRPINKYAWSKRAAEELVLGQGHLNATVIRPRGLYGHGDTALLPRLVRAARKGPLPLFRDGSAVIDLTHVDDVVSAILAILEAPDAARGKVYNVSGGQPLPVRTIIQSAAEKAGVAVAWKPTPWPVARAALTATEAWHRAFIPKREPVATVYSAGLLAFSQTMNIGLIRDEIGWRPEIPFALGLERTFKGAA
jgi:nucleoside-diphosphate-sugar epimerase